MIQSTTRRERFDELLDGCTIYDDATIEAYSRDALPRYAAKFFEGGAGSGYSDNPDCVARDTLAELASYATSCLGDDPAWAPAEMIDLDTGDELSWTVKVEVSA